MPGQLTPNPIVCMLAIYLKELIFVGPAQTRHLMLTIYLKELIQVLLTFQIMLPVPV